MIVCDGGASQQIINAIGRRKPPGTGTYGSQSGTWVDPAGVSQSIDFNYTASQRIEVVLNIHQLAGYVTTTEALIIAAMQSYINSQQQGVTIYYNTVIGAATLFGTPQQPTFEIKTTSTIVNHTAGGSPGNSDLTMTVFQDGNLAAADVTINYV
jgi:hypothetical protein